MKRQDRTTIVGSGLVLLVVLVGGSSQAAPLGAIADESVEPSQLLLQPFFEFERATLTVEGPAGLDVDREFGPGETVRLALLDGEGRALPDGSYRYSLRLTRGPASASGVQTGLFFVDEGAGVSRTARRDQLASIRDSLNRAQERWVQAMEQAAAISQAEEGVSLTPPSSYALSIDGDFALGGNVFKEGKPFMHNIGGAAYGNTAVGLRALESATPSPYGHNGERNSAFGYGALRENTTGHFNTAAGFQALISNTTGMYNTACGGRALFWNTTGSYNTATGLALGFNTTGVGNTANGFGALSFNVTGTYNTAAGLHALILNKTGFYNTASGNRALRSNSTGDLNTASGNQALRSNTTGDLNTAFGAYALYSTTGNRNVGIGSSAGQFSTDGNDNIFISNEGSAEDSQTIRIGTQGTHTRIFVAGITGVAVAGGRRLLVDSNGQLGVAAFSSRAHKTDIHDIDEASSSILRMRPVTFRYREEVHGADDRLQYGLLAEEVAEVNPDLVLYSDDGEILGVRYELLAPLLLNELKKQHRLNQEQGGLLRKQREELESLRARLAQLEALLLPGPSDEGS